MHLEGNHPELSYPSSMPVPTLSLVMPCYNECDQIERIIGDWVQTMQENAISYELVIVNDGSLDGTGRVLDKLRREMRQIRVIHQLNNGHGKAVRRGYELSRGTWVLQIDSNGCFDPTDFQLLWEKREEADLLLGQRTHRLDSFFRRTLIKILSRFIRSTHHVEIQDPDVSFRLFRRSAVMQYLRLIPKSVQSVNLAMTVILKKETPERVIDIRIPYRLRPIARGRMRLRAHVMQLFHTMSELMQLKVNLKIESI